MGFPGGSDGKESASIAGDLGLIPGLGRSPGVGDLPNPGIEPTSPALQADSFTVQAFPEERL